MKPARVFKILISADHLTKLLKLPKGVQVVASAVAEPGQVGFALIDQTGEFSLCDRVFDIEKQRWVKVKNKGSTRATTHRAMRKIAQGFEKIAKKP